MAERSRPSSLSPFAVQMEAVGSWRNKNDRLSIDNQLWQLAISD